MIERTAEQGIAYQRKAAADRKRGREWASGMTASDADQIDAARFGGEWDWRDWLEEKPSAAFWQGVYSTWRAEHPGRF
jgi:hypothetical protein